MRQPVGTMQPLAFRKPGLARVAAPLLVALALSGGPDAAAQAGAEKAPPTLGDTGLYANVDVLEVDPRHLAFSPQYPLWTDGAAKKRWISLPPGTAIDGADAEAWVFPVGTRLWKEFSFNGQRVETRYLERQPDGEWLYAAYAWSADGRAARLVSENGRPGAYQLAGGRTHDIPSVNDCKACHQGTPSRVLGFSSLQLSPDRDPGALHAELGPAAALDLDRLIDKGLLVGMRKARESPPPRITATSATERAALGYMHGNCGHCHNDRAPLQNIGLFLRARSGADVQPAIATTVGQPIRKPAPGQAADTALRIKPGEPDKSGLVQRIGSRYSALQMPPLGTELIDKDAVELLQRWVKELEHRDAPVN